MAFYTVYWDDSGTHKESSGAVAACFVATAEQWQHFRKNWDEANASEGFDVFHMADFAAGKGQFEGWNNEKKQRTLTRLCSNIGVRINCGIAFVIDKKEYEEIVPADSEWRTSFGTFHYTFAVRQCAIHIRNWHLKYGKGSDIEYVFDRMSRGKGEIMAVMDQAMSTSKSNRHKNVQAPILSGYTFEDKTQVVQLQASDILAWSALQLYHEKRFGRPLRWEAEMSLQVFGPRVRASHLTRENLAKFVELEKEAIQECLGQPRS